MKIPKIATAMDELDPELVAAAAKPVRAARRPWVKWAVLAAALGVVVLLSVLLVPLFLRGDDPTVTPGNTVSFGSLDRNYKEQSVAGQEFAMDWPAEYLTPVEKHARIVWMFREYVTSGNAISPQNLGSKIGSHLGYEIREVKGAQREHVIAVGFDGVFYSYRCSEGYHSKPETLGELFDRYNLAGVLTLDRFTRYEDRYTEAGYYALTDDDYIIEVLAGCREASVYYGADTWEKSEEYLSFTITSEALGVYKRAMYITEDGYLWTNVFDLAYVYVIGEEAAGKIIDYAMTHAEQKDTYEPYEYRLVGTLVDVRDGYAYIDDSIMCVDESEGMLFCVSAADMRVKRSLELGGVQAGDLVVITFRGGVDTENGNLITGVQSLQKGYFANGDVVVPE